MNIGLIIPNSSDQRARVLTKFINATFPTAGVTSINLRVMVPGFWRQKRNTKATYEATDEGRAALPAVLAKLFPRYDAIICIDEAFAHYVLPDASGVTSTDKLSGMIVEVAGKNVLFHLDPLHLYGRMWEDEHKAAYALVSAFHLRKLRNVLQGLPPNELPVRYMLPRTIADLRAVERIAAQSDLIAFDIETSGGYVSCVGFSCAGPWPVRPTFVIPLFHAIEGTDGMYWEDDASLTEAINTIGRILGNPVPKAAHNGAYDLTHLFRMGLPANNYAFDTMAMLHSMWPTVPKSLYMGASLFLQGYRYWKDDAKDVGEDGKVKWQTPKTAEKTWRYWRYNGADCANTLELCLAILGLWQGAPDAQARFPHSNAGYDHCWLTYVREFAVEFGPCLYMSMSGLRADPLRQAQMKSRLHDEADEAAEYLATLIGDPDFNPNSSQQVASLLYDVLDLKPLARKGRTTDKRILQKFADMHPIYADVIGAIAAVKEPRNNASKYCEAPYWKGRRMLYQMKGANTTTRRLASSKHNYGWGTQFQNVPKPMRALFFADEGELLVATDYAQSDSYFVAFESGDEVMIETVTDDRDTHSVHVSFFFGVEYEAVVAGAEAKEAWVVHPITGLRQIIKKVTHGTNYDMGGDTMLLNVRREAAISLVNSLLDSPSSRVFMRFMGLDESKGIAFYAGKGALWSDAQLAKACEFAQRLYYTRYPKLAKWKKNAVLDATKSHGVITMFGGSTTTMLTSPSSNPRFVPASYGQGGTSGNINNAMLRLFYNADWMWQRGFRMVIQVHDELICAIPEDRLGLVDAKTAIMETPCTIRGRTFTVPVEAELSRSWSPKHTVVWHGLDAEHTPDWYLAQIAAKEQKLQRELGLA